LEAAAKEQGLTFQQGNILVVRSGLTKWYNNASDEEKYAWFSNPSKAAVGVAPTLEAVAWVWDHHVSAVAGDTLAWEHVRYPPDQLCKLK
jgi:kynurenine formamidase